MGSIVAYYVVCFLVFAVPATVGLMLCPSSPETWISVFGTMLMVLGGALIVLLDKEVRSDLKSWWKSQ